MDTNVWAAKHPLIGGYVTRKNQLTKGQIIGIINLAEVGQKVADVCHDRGVSEGIHFRWKAKYGGLDGSHLRQPEDENWKLKLIVAGPIPIYSSFNRHVLDAPALVDTPAM